MAGDIQKAVGVGSVAFGAVAVLTPRLFLGVYGLQEEEERADDDAALGHPHGRSWSFGVHLGRR
jgi:hypothetical protein